MSYKIVRCWVRLEELRLTPLRKITYDPCLTSTSSIPPKAKVKLPPKAVCRFARNTYAPPEVPSRNRRRSDKHATQEKENQKKDQSPRLGTPRRSQRG